MYAVCKSEAERDRRPGTSKIGDCGTMRISGRLPFVGRKPKRPLAFDGSRIEPPVSLAVPKSTQSYEATPAPVPHEEKAGHW